jgi:1-phosphofructokinase family hexose kinase
LDREKGTMTEIYEIGESVPLKKIDELRDHFRKTIGKYKAVTLSGSMPPGVPTHFYADLIEIARKENVPSFLDSSGDALRKGLEAGPFFVKPNETEAKTLLGIGPGESVDFMRTASEVSTKYGVNVLLSLGALGAVAAKAGETFIVKNPSVEAKSAVGSGDCTLAGLVYGFLNGLSFEEFIRCGVAAGTANTLTIGAGQFKLEDFERLRGQVSISHGAG